MRGVTFKRSKYRKRFFVIKKNHFFGNNKLNVLIFNKRSCTYLIIFEMK